MTVDWASGVNTRILRNGTSWETPQKFITDKTRSGKPKRRMANSSDKRPFNVKMKFTPTEYNTFLYWFENTTINGLYSFYFPQIDSQGHNTMKAYQFAEGGLPVFSNTNGINIDCTMVWEEV